MCILYEHRSLHRPNQDNLECVCVCVDEHMAAHVLMCTYVSECVCLCIQGTDCVCGCLWHRCVYAQRRFI